MRCLAEWILPTWLENLPLIEYILSVLLISLIGILVHYTLNKYEKWRYSLLKRTIKKKSLYILNFLTLLKSLNTILWHVLIFTIFLILLEYLSKVGWNYMEESASFKENQFYVAIFGGIGGFIIAEVLSLFKNIKIDYNKNKYKIIRFIINETKIIDNEKKEELYYLKDNECLKTSEKRDISYVMINQVNSWEKDDPEISIKEKRRRVAIILKNLNALRKSN